MLFCTCGNKSVLSQEYLDDASGDFVVNNASVVFASDVDSKNLINNEKIILDETTDTHKYVI